MHRIFRRPSQHRWPQMAVRDRFATPETGGSGIFHTYSRHIAIKTSFKAIDYKAWVVIERRISLPGYHDVQEKCQNPRKPPYSSAPRFHFLTMTCAPTKRLFMEIRRLLLLAPSRRPLSRNCDILAHASEFRRQGPILAHYMLVHNYRGIFTLAKFPNAVRKLASP